MYKNGAALKGLKIKKARAVRVGGYIYSHIIFI